MADQKSWLPQAVEAYRAGKEPKTMAEAYALMGAGLPPPPETMPAGMDKEEFLDIQARWKTTTGKMLMARGRMASDEASKGR